ncbi:hypothetical protein AVEN_201253-1 [Araneus ventricosus]|uniref:Uncharacterized protein n=1 Tax=Araneus ventricosus TaxID=182803 RepID=A0A4Y2X6F2_ARAVE|nr:hypothetical protein AVEN_176177-1 [Araneus ventricosus]GBO45371.1 hypothetical protein AVEN_201253-1 [Araneus ventricosus]
MVDLKKNEIRTGGGEIPLFSGSSQSFWIAQICSNGLSCQDLQKGVLVATTHVDLKRKAITIRVLNLDNKPKTVDKGAVIATC